MNAMSNDLFSSLLEDMDPAEVNFRYLLHASIMRKGQTEKLTGTALRRFINRAPEFKDVEEYSFAINWAVFLMDTEDEMAYIKSRVMALLKPKGL